MREEILNHPCCIDPRTPEEVQAGEPLVPVRVITLGDFAVTLRAWVWSDSTPNSKQLEWDVTESIKKRFDNEGVEIPYPYRTVVYKKDLPDEERLQQ